MVIVVVCQRSLLVLQSSQLESSGHANYNFTWSHESFQLVWQSSQLVNSMRTHLGTNAEINASILLEAWNIIREKMIYCLFRHVFYHSFVLWYCKRSETKKEDWTRVWKEYLLGIIFRYCIRKRLKRVVGWMSRQVDGVCGWSEANGGSRVQPWHGPGNQWDLHRRTNVNSVSRESTTMPVTRSSVLQPYLFLLFIPKKYEMSNRGLIIPIAVIFVYRWKSSDDSPSTIIKTPCIFIRYRCFKRTWKISIGIQLDLFEVIKSDTPLDRSMDLELRQLHGHGCQSMRKVHRPYYLTFTKLD